MSATILSVRGLGRRYVVGDRAIAALDDVSLDVEAGAVVAVSGPSGSGKSTLLHLIALLDVPDTGDIYHRSLRLDARDRPQAAAFRARHLGIVFQAFNLLPMLSALENVELALQPIERDARARTACARESLERVGLAERLAHRPAQLSAGQQQRVGIARATVKRPDLVIADEPTANLDGAQTRSMLALVRALAVERGTAFLIATHDARCLASADRRYALQDGRLVA